MPKKKPQIDPNDFTGENVTLCDDGKYRWLYQFDMLKNPVILFTTWRVLGMSFFIVWAFTLTMSLIEDGFKLDAFIGITRGFLLLGLFMCALGVVAYLIIAGQYGWRYMVVFEMDDEGITHRQMKSQFDKAKALMWLTAAVGGASGSLSTAAIGINAATRDSLSTDFDKVKKVKVSKWRNTIYVNAPFSHNQVYVKPEDFDFVLQYILGRVPIEVSEKVKK